MTSRSQIALAAILTTTLLVACGRGNDDDDKVQTRAAPTPPPTVVTQDTCGTLATARGQAEYCITAADRSRNPDIVFYLHGLGGNAQEWTEAAQSRQVRELWRASGQGAPVAIAFSFGRQWLVTDRPVNGAPSLQDVVTEDLIPRLEALVGGLGNGRRILVGASMGGFNASMLLLKAQDRFAKVALLCPAIVTISPFSSVAEIADYVDRTGARPENVALILALGRNEFRDPATWARHNALELAESRLSPASPPLYLSVGRRDEYGYFLGSQRFVEIARRQGAPIEWVPLDSGHCAIDPPTLAEFLTRP